MGNCKTEIYNQNHEVDIKVYEIRVKFTIDIPKETEAMETLQEPYKKTSGQVFQSFKIRCAGIF